MSWFIIILLLILAEMYCPIVIAENGLKIMGELLKHNFTLTNQDYEPRVIHSLAQTVINQCIFFLVNHGKIMFRKTENSNFFFI